MANRNYIKGRSKEYEVKHILEKLGFLVIRSAGSKSPIDLIAIRQDYILAIQVKSIRHENMIPVALKEIDMSLNGIRLHPSIQFEAWIFILNEGKPRVYRRDIKRTDNYEFRIELGY